MVTDEQELLKNLRSVVYLNHGKWCTEAADLIESQQARIEELEEKLHRIEQWCKAYPRTVFIEPTKAGWARANEVLDAAADCPSLTAISGSNMRHVVEGIQALAALQTDKEPDGD